MDDKELMFDKDSFSALKNTAEAASAYNYFAHNLTTFRSQAEEKLGYSEGDKMVHDCWENLIQSCKKVGYTNTHMENMKKLYKID
jgi:hypothetical protein